MNIPIRPRSPRNIRRILIIITLVVLIQATIIGGFLSVRAKPNLAPQLVYTSIVANANLLPSIRYIALPELPCVALADVKTENAFPLPRCTETRAAPEDAKLLGENTFIQMDFMLDDKGRVQNPTLAQSSGFPKLDEAAIAQVRDTWIFSPCTEEDPQHCLRSIQFRWQHH